MEEWKEWIILDDEKPPRNINDIMERLRAANRVAFTLLKEKAGDEKQKHHKTVLQRYSGIVRVISETRDPMLKLHLYLVLLHKRRPDLETVAYNIQNPADQKAAHAVLDRAKVLEKELLPLEKDYMQSEFAMLFHQAAAYAEWTVPPKPFFHAKSYEPSITYLMAGFGFVVLFSTLYAVVEGLRKHGTDALLKESFTLLGFTAVAALLFSMAYWRHKLRKRYVTLRDAHLQELIRWQKHKKEVDYTLELHRVHEIIRIIKHKYPEYEPAWQQIKQLEQDFDKAEKRQTVPPTPLNILLRS